ncbi:MAG: VOC family protein [Pseudomonadota bacterium]|nr:VOC family protein [Pseudomonadota bacterium]
MNDVKILGRFFWYDLMTSDPAAARVFYANVIGWSMQPWGPPEGAYTMVANAEGPVGGIAELGKDESSVPLGPPHWLAYVGTPDIDATVEQAKALGGKVLVPVTEIPTVGRFAVLADPQGAVFAPFTPASSTPGMPERSADAPGRFSWHELHTSEPDAGYAFYSELFGWGQTGEMDMGPMGLYRMFGQTPDRSLGGVMTTTHQAPVPGWTCYITVADIKGTLDRVRANEGQVVYGPDEVPGGDLVAACIDPQGAAFAVFQKAAVR